jgi:beta-N-acetylhexosaminidase
MLTHSRTRFVITFVLFILSMSQSQQGKTENLIGRLLLLSFRGDEPPLEQLHSFQPAGFIFFPSNVSSAEAARKATSTLQQAAAYPLIFAIDQEGGPFTTYRVGDATVFPGNMALGATGDTRLATAVGRATAEELSYLGINLNFAPSVDVNLNPDNPVIGIRSFGADPTAVAGMGTAYLEGLTEGGIAATAKHFPGHGDTNVDSHSALPVISKSLEVLNTTELVPFRALIEAGVPVIMTSHILFPELDDTPATLSKTIISDVLRGQLGFQGVVVTDYMDMAAIADTYGAGEAAVRSVLAGSDLVEVGPDPDVQAEVYQALKNAYTEGRLTETRIRDAVARSSQLAERFPARWSSAPPDYAAHQALALQVAEQSATLLTNRVLPLNKSQNVLVVAPQPDAFGLPPHLGSVLKRYGTNIRSQVISESPTSDDVQAAVTNATTADVIVLGAYQWLGEGEGIKHLSDALLATGKPLVVVTLGNPNALSQQATQFAAYVAVYGYREANLEGAVQLIFGRKPQGRLPLPIASFPIHSGLSDF